MKRKQLFLSFIVITASIVTGCSFFSKGNTATAPYWQKNGVTSFSFQKADLDLLQAYTSLDTSPDSSIYTGDVTGDAKKEIIIVSKNTIAIYSLTGKLIRKKTFEDTNFGSGTVADIDGDGKQDIILGCKKGKGIQILSYSGVLSELVNFIDSKIYNAETKIQFYKEGKIYFSTVSSLEIPPKIVGAYDISNNSLAWKYFTGPVPIDVAADRDFDKFTISNKPKSAKGLVLDKRTVSDHSKFQSSIYVLGINGKRKTQLSIGPEYRVGEFQDGGISSVAERFFDIDNNGTSELLVGINRVSDFYKGKAALEIRSLDGEIKARREFTPDTEIEYSFYKKRGNAVIAALLKQNRTFYLLDNKLSVKRERTFTEVTGIGTLQESGDFNGDGRMEYLLTIGSRLYLLGSDLKTIYSTAERTYIQKAFFVPDASGKAVLAVLSNTLTLYRIGKDKTGSVSLFTNPAGASIFMNRTLLDPTPESGLIAAIPAGTVTFQAKMDQYVSPVKKIKVKAGHHYEVTLNLEGYNDKVNSEHLTFKQKKEISAAESPEIPLQKWENIHLSRKTEKEKNEKLMACKDYASNGEKDFLFYDLKRHILITRSSSMQLLGQASLPSDSYFILPDGAALDINADGKEDLLTYSRKSSAFSVYSAAGKLLAHKCLGHFPNTRMNHALINQGGMLYINFVTGYVQQPRGIMVIDLYHRSRIHSFFPIAANPIGLLLTGGGTILPDIHTPSNGAAVTYPNGDTANDSEYYVYMMDKDGNPLPESFNPSFKDNNGTLFYYAADLNNDGKQEVYMIANKTNYYTGTTRLVRINVLKGSISKTFFSPGKNKKISIQALVTTKNKRLLAVYQYKPGELYLLDSNFTIERKYDMDSRGFANPGKWLFTDINGDGISEMFFWRDDGLFIYSPDFKLLFSITKGFGEDPLKNVIVNDINNDGKAEIILFSDNAVSVYNY